MKRWEKSYVGDVEDGAWYEHSADTLHYDWCCDCHLRHIVEYRIEKNKAGKPVVLRRSWRDSFATELRRRSNKLSRRPPQRRKK